MKNLFIIAGLFVVMASCNNGGGKKSAAKVPLKSLSDSFAYAYGSYVGGMLHSTNIKDINWEVFKAAYEHAMANGDTGMLLDKETVGRVLNEYSLEAKFGQNRKKGEEYIAKRKSEGFTVTKSGLLFKQIKKGNGVKPLITDTVLVFFTGKFTNGETFDTNEGKEPYKTSLNAGAIPGFLEALQMMDEGSEAEVIIPYQLAYGKEGNRNPYTGEMSMEPYQTLVFNLKLVGIKR